MRHKVKKSLTVIGATVFLAALAQAPAHAAYGDPGTCSYSPNWVKPGPAWVECWDSGYATLAKQSEYCTRWGDNFNSDYDDRLCQVWLHSAKPYVTNLKRVSGISYNCTPVAQARHLGYSETKGTSFGFGLSAGVSAKIFEMVEVKVEARFDVRWDEQKTWSDVVDIWVPPGQYGWIEMGDPMVRAELEYYLHFLPNADVPWRDTSYHYMNMELTAPDPVGHPVIMWKTAKMTPDMRKKCQEGITFTP